MTTETEVKWEEITDLEQLKIGDELEYICPGLNKEFKYWGKVIDIQRSGGLIPVVHMEGDWKLLPSSLTVRDGVNKLTRKVEVFVWPDYVGACVEVSKGDEVRHFVRVSAAGPNWWVIAETGEFFATWEVELVTNGYNLHVVGLGY